MTLSRRMWRLTPDLCRLERRAPR